MGNDKKNVRSRNKLTYVETEEVIEKAIHVGRTGAKKSDTKVAIALSILGAVLVTAQMIQIANKGIVSDDIVGGLFIVETAALFIVGSFLMMITRRMMTSMKKALFMVLAAVYFLNFVGVIAYLMMTVTIVVG